MALDNGLQIPSGIQPLTPTPVDTWSGPYSADTIENAISLAYSSIPSSVRFKTMEVRIITPDTTAKYWFKDGIDDSSLVEVNSGAMAVGNGLSITDGSIGLGGSLSGITNITTNNNLFAINGEFAPNNGVLFMNPAGVTYVGYIGSDSKSSVLGFSNDAVIYSLNGQNILQLFSDNSLKLFDNSYNRVFDFSPSGITFPSLSSTGATGFVQVDSSGKLFTAGLPVASVYYQQIENAGSSVTQRLNLNFDNNFVVTDNSGNNSTDISLSSLNWNNITGTPITLSGYGINDAYSKYGGDIQYTSNNGYVGLPTQSGNVATPASGVRLFYKTGGGFSWIGANGYSRSFLGSGISGDRVYTLTDKSGVLALSGDNISEFVNDAGYITSAALPVANNPSTSIGLTSVNGSASTFMRSDAAPALSQSITPVWAGQHTFTKGLITSGNTSAAAWGINGINIQAKSATYSDISSVSGTVTGVTAVNSLLSPTISGASGVVYANTANLYVAAPSLVNATSSSNNAIYAAGSIVSSSQLTAPVLTSLGGGSFGAWGTNGIAIRSFGSVFNDTSSNGTVANMFTSAINANTITANSATTYTNAGSLYIAGAPITGSNVTFTNSYALYVNAGISLFGGVVAATGGISTQSNSTPSTTANFSSAGGASGNISSSSSLNTFGGAGIVQARSMFAGNSAFNVSSNSSYTNVLVGSSPVNTNVSGTTHSIFANMVVNPVGTITSNGATVTNTASLYVNGAATGGTNNYSLFVNSGNVSLGSGNISIGNNYSILGNARLSINATVTGPNTTTSGVHLNVGNNTYTDNSTSASGTSTFAVQSSFLSPTFAAVNSGVTYTNAATVFIGGAPLAGSNAAINNSYALYVANGASYLNGSVSISSSVGLNVGSNPSAQLHIGGNLSNTGNGTSGARFRIDANVLTDTGSTGTVANMMVNSLGSSTLAANSATTYTNAATLYINNAPLTGTNVTITNPYSIYVANGTAYFGGSVRFNGLFNANGTNLTANQIWGANAGANAMEGKTLSGTQGISVTHGTGTIGIGLGTNVTVGHLVGGTSTPTVASGASSGGAVSIAGSDLGGYINVTTGAAPSSAGAVVTVTFNTAYSVIPKCIIIEAANANAAALNGANKPYVNQADITTTTFAIKAGSTALAANTTYQWYYKVVQ